MTLRRLGRFKDFALTWTATQFLTSDPFVCISVFSRPRRKSPISWLAQAPQVSAAGPAARWRYVPVTPRSYCLSVWSVIGSSAKRRGRCRRGRPITSVTCPHATSTFRSSCLRDSSSLSVVDSGPNAGTVPIASCLIRHVVRSFAPRPAVFHA